MCTSFTPRPFLHPSDGVPKGTLSSAAALPPGERTAQASRSRSAPEPPLGPLDPLDPPSRRGRRGRRRRPECTVYLDLDGTLVEPDGRIVPETLQALALVRERGWRPVLLTGRSRWAADAVARALGVDDVISELGAVVSVGEHLELAAPEAVPFPREALLAALPSRLTQEHAPGVPRMSGLVLRSALSAAELTDELHGRGLRGWCCVDNGASHAPLQDGRAARVLHVLPSGVDKATGIRLHLQLRDLRPDECVVIGDSPADLGCRDVIARTVLVRSGDTTAVEAAAADGVPVTGARGAKGALEAIRTLTAERLGPV
jgi:hypothetical protein